MDMVLIWLKGIDCYILILIIIYIECYFIDYLIILCFSIVCVIFRYLVWKFVVQDIGVKMDNVYLIMVKIGYK